MRTLPALVLATAAVLAGCGQKGPLVKPSRTPTSPVVIRAPAPPATPPADSQPPPPPAAPQH
ncbi:MAG: lipoprotein [Pseudomonadota bacterium]|nr:lipoprotein [Pseudomonadota bacterium]